MFYYRFEMVVRFIPSRIAADRLVSTEDDWWYRGWRGGACTARSVSFERTKKIDSVFGIRIPLSSTSRYSCRTSEIVLCSKNVFGIASRNFGEMARAPLLPTKPRE